MATQQERPISDLAKIFPEMTPGEFAALVESIREEGLHDPIALWQGQVIDGRHRYAACAEAGVQPRFHHLADDDDPLRYVLAKNALRRHLTESQRAVVAHRLSAGSAPGRPRKQDNVANLPISFTMQQAADMLRVSKRMVGHAGRVLSVGGPAAPALRQAVEQGAISVSDASRVVDQTVEVQVAALERVVRGESRTMAGAVQRVNREMAVEEDRAAREYVRAKPLGETITLHRAGVAELHRLVAPASVDVIITNPPAWSEWLPLFTGLAGFASHALRPTGVMAVLATALLLPETLKRLDRSDLKWVLELDYLCDDPVNSGPPHWLKQHRRPLLVYGKPRFQFEGGADLIRVPSEATARGGRRPSNDAGMALIVERLARPGQLVCDPVLLDRSSTALAARKHGCLFIGATKEQSSLDRIRHRLARGGK